MTSNQRWARWLYLMFGLVTLLIWIFPLVSFWNTYQTLDLRHSGVGVSPDHASAWATGVVTVGWIMFTVWATPQIKHWFWSYFFIYLGIIHLAAAMGIFLFIRLTKPLAEFFLEAPVPLSPRSASGSPRVPLLLTTSPTPNSARGVAASGSTSARRSAIASPPTSARASESASSRRTPRRAAQ